MTENSLPTVSIGVPVFNGANFLAEALDSILAQTYTDFELIIADNASTDETEEICRQFASRDSRVRYHRNETNRGAAANYNFLVECARGKYFKWAAHDDTCEPDFIRRCVETLDEHPETAVCYSKSFVIDGDGEVVCRYSDKLHIPDDSARLRLRRYMKTNFMRHAGMCNPVFGLIRKDLLLQTSLIQPFVASDRSLLAQLAVLGTFHELPEYLFRRRVHREISTFASRDIKSRQAWFQSTGTGSAMRFSLLPNNHFAVRFKQVNDISNAISGFQIDAKSRRSCQRELAHLFVRDPKWIYLDLRNSLNMGQSRADIMNRLKSRND